MRGCLYSKRSSRMFSTRSAPRRKALSIESSSPWSSWRASAGCSATENACYFPTVNRVSTEAPATAVVVRKGSHVPTLGQRRTAHCGDESEPPRHVLSRHAASMGRTLGMRRCFRRVPSNNPQGSSMRRNSSRWSDFPSLRSFFTAPF